ncbi:hypothetical protein N2152v2_007100 [Parachlorella kessleri]
MALELPNWNEALSLEPEWEEPAIAQPVPKSQLLPRTAGTGDASGLRAEGLDALPNALEADYWLRKAAAEENGGDLEAAYQVLKQALDRDVRPVTDVLRAMQDLSKRMEPQEASAEDAGNVLAEVGNRAPTRFTPSKTGLTGKAVRVPSRFARTPGAAAPAAAAVPYAGTATTAAKPTLTSVLKRLTFSAAKPGLATAGAESSSSATPHPHRQRHVSFGAGTVSPAARPALRRQSHVHFQTPQPTIEEGEAAESPAPSKVNSVNAGRTPYDARLSGLLHRYKLPGTPEVPSSDEGNSDDDADQEPVGRSPSWRDLSASLSVPDSIKGLAKKYSSDVESILGLSSPELSPLATTPLSTLAARSEHSAGASPPLAPTPHHLLEGWQSNGVYESPSQTAGVTVAAAPAASSPSPAALAPKCAAEEKLTPVPQDMDAACEGTVTTHLAEPLLAGDVSPISGAIHLAAAAPADFLPAEIQDASSPVNQAQTPLSNSAAATSDIDMSPLTIGRSPAEDEELNISATPSYFDGVPRDAAGIPLITPATVTVARGGQLNSATFRDDGLAANLFETFESPKLAGSSAISEVGVGTDFTFAPNPTQSSLEQDDEGDTPNLQPRASSDEEGESVEGFAFVASPEILGHEEEQHLVAGSVGEAGAHVPRSALKAQQPLAVDGTPLLGRAQRVPSPTKMPRGSAAKEVRALLAGLSLEDREEVEGRGTLAMLSPVRAHSHLRAQLGVDKVVTPVRRSVRHQIPHAPLPDLLEQTNFSYVPNEALMAEEAAKPEAGKAGPEKVKTGGAEQEQTAPNTESHRTQTSRKSRLQASSSDSATPAAAAGVIATAQPAGHRYNTRRSSMHTPSLSLRRVEAEDAEVFTPPAPAALRLQHSQADDAKTMSQVPVPQDGSPALTESPGLGPAAAPPQAETAADIFTALQRSRRRKSMRHATPGPLAVAGSADDATTPVRSLPASVERVPASHHMTRRKSLAAAAAGTPANTTQVVSLSPTEAQIRTQLRRSARKSSVRRDE